MKKFLRMYITAWYVNMFIMAIFSVSMMFIHGSNGLAPPWVITWLIVNLVLLALMGLIAIIAYWKDIIDYIKNG